MSSAVLIDNIPITFDRFIVGAIATNVVLNNNGANTVDVTLALNLDQTPGPIDTIFQSWKRFSVAPGENVYFESTYFLTDAQLEDISFNMETMTQKFQLILTVSVGSTTDFTLVTIPDSVNYSLTPSTY